MRLRSPAFPTLFLLVFLLMGSIPATLPAQRSSAPHLETRGAATQLIVDGAPFLMLAGELYNSSSSSLDNMKPVWPRLAALGLNTVLTPLSWELIEPTEGAFDFTLLDGLLAQARAQHMHIVFLWLASWKNGMSSYPPVWVKRDTRRFPRVIENGNEVDILSTFGAATLAADARAFAAVMRHLREVDGRDHTVLMMQVENEVGILGSSRDRSPIADRAFASDVPADLLRYLRTHRDSLDPDLRDRRQKNQERTSGTWTQVFGDTPRTDEIFMAWQYARYVQAVAAAGKTAYDIPMYVNTWLAAEDNPPGNYPSGGPEPWVLDIWKAAGSALDLYSPDLYASNFASWAERYHRADNALFIPETRGAAAGAANVFYAIGEQAAIGFSPFGIDSPAVATADLGESYRALAEISPLLLDQQAKSDVHGFILDRAHPEVEFVMSGYTLHVSLDELFHVRTENGFGLIAAAGPDQFVGVGKGFKVDFTSRSSTPPNVGLASVDEGGYAGGKWTAGRRLNGDENDQGRYWRFDSRRIETERAVLYRFE